MSGLPSLASKLKLDFLDNYMIEKSLHRSEQYTSLLKKQRRTIKKTNVCCYCGFPDGRFLELHHINSNHQDYSQNNLAYICTLCHRLNHLGWVGTDNLGDIFYVPAIVGKSKQRFWLEPLHHVQRFYLMKDRLKFDEKQRLNQTAINQNINSLMDALKGQDVEARQIATKRDRADYLKEARELEQAAPNEKTELLQTIKANRDERKKELEQAQIGTDFSDLHILDLLRILVETGTKQSFLTEQDKGNHGRMAIWFNSTVFKPFEDNPEYTLEDRLDYYQKLNFFSATGLQNFMHNIRKNSKH